MIYVNTAACDACGTCVGVCPSDALVLEQTVSVADANACTGCGTCVRVCPFGALSETPVSAKESAL
jgi:ferredoxin